MFTVGPSKKGGRPASQSPALHEKPPCLLTVVNRSCPTFAGAAIIPKYSFSLYCSISIVWLLFDTLNICLTIWSVPRVTMNNGDSIETKLKKIQNEPLTLTL